MIDSQGYEILHNGVPRTFRDRRDTALEAAQFAKSRAKGDIIELCDCSSGKRDHPKNPKGTSDPQ